MPQNVHGLLRRWWGEQHKIARESGSIVGALSINNAEARMVVISSLLGLVNPSRETSDAGEKELWVGICTIAAMQFEWEPGAWVSALKQPHIEELAKTL